ncbi:MAG: galactosyltransferase-related protein [Cyanobacteria bacterium P01_G01_bin.54]
MRLTLITPYRDRLSHLKTQLDWWAGYAGKAAIEWLVIELTPDPSEPLPALLQSHGIRYLHLPCVGPFHKTKALNVGLAQAQGELVAAFDVDLIPVGETLTRHCELAVRSPHLLLTGYRLMAATETVDVADLGLALAQATLGPEDQPTALRKHLLAGERFGVMPLFWRDRLRAIGGWDEAFVGWGAEDQELMERYLLPEQGFCRSPELVYLHLAHGLASDWNEAELTERNRAYYYWMRQI